MVTDQQFQQMQKRIDELEKTVKVLSMSLTEMKMMYRGRAIEAPKRADATKRDKTRYIFNGKKYTKRSLVLSGIKMYINDHDITASSKLFEAFPQEIQGSLGIARPMEEAELYENAQARYYFGDEDILHFEDGLYAVCKEWTSKNIDSFINAMENCGYSITIINR